MYKKCSDFVSYKVDKYTNIYICTHIKILQNLIIHDCPPYDYIPLNSRYGFIKNHTLYGNNNRNILSMQQTSNHL